MKLYILFFTFLCCCMKVSAQHNDVLCDLIVQSLDSYFSHFESSENEYIRDSYRNRTKYVCTDGLPIGFYFNKRCEYVYHSSDYKTIKKLAKLDKAQSITTLIVSIFLDKDVITICVGEVSMLAKSKKVKGVRERVKGWSHGSMEYSYKYDPMLEKWSQIVLSRDDR